jgi:hypothetical protein
MGLFDFFKRREKLRGDFGQEKCLGKILSQGILFEDNNKFLKWGTPVKELFAMVDVSEKKFADRTVYNWGEHTILGGLKLELITVYWSHSASSIDKLFNSIEFLATGDDNAGKYLRLIGLHLEGKFGPGRNIEGEPKTYFEWIVNDARITLRFMERVANKLHFEISAI